MIEVTELLGDGIGPELEIAVAAVSDAIPVDLHFNKIDWTLERRTKEGMVPILEGEESLRTTHLALKYPTITKVESPNAILRRRCGFSVIYRPVASIPGISSNFTENLNVHIVRVATGGTYDDPGQLIGEEAAVSLRIVERGPCQYAASFAFDLAKDHAWTVTSASKHTIQRVTDGFFESVVGEVSKRYPYVKHKRELFDALLGKIVLSPQDFEVVLVLNEYGDFLSDLASGMVGSLGTGASGNFAFNKDNTISMAMFDPAGGTAPDIAGKNMCNPSAILLALSMLLEHIGQRKPSADVKNAVFSAIADGAKTRDLGGRLSTTEFTQEVVQRIKSSDD
jgi:isocitrate dehydrogenase (NAD+)